MQEDDQAFALATDKVILARLDTVAFCAFDGLAALGVRLYQTLHDVLVLLWQDELAEAFRPSLEIGDLLDVKCSCDALSA